MGNVICSWWLFDISRYWICSPVPHFVPCLHLLLLLFAFRLPCRRQLWCIFNFAVFLLLFFFTFCSSLLKVWRGDFCAGVAAKLPKSCSAPAPVEVFLRFHSQILFSLFFLSLLTSPSHLYWFGFCTFACALCRKPAEMLAVFRLALTWPWKPNYICGLFRIC